MAAFPGAEMSGEAPQVTVRVTIYILSLLLAVRRPLDSRKKEEGATIQ